MKKRLFFVAFGSIAMCTVNSCKKFTCICSTYVYDANGNFTSSISETHEVSATGIFRAEPKCDEYSNEYNGCSIK